MANEPGPEWWEKYRQISRSVYQIRYQDIPPFVRHWIHVLVDHWDSRQFFDLFFTYHGCIIALAPDSADTARRRYERAWEEYAPGLKMSYYTLRSKANVNSSSPASKPCQKSLLVLFLTDDNTNTKEDRRRKSGLTRTYFLNNEVPARYLELVKEFINPPTADKKRKLDSMSSVDEEDRPSKCPRTSQEPLEPQRAPTQDLVSLDTGPGKWHSLYDSVWKALDFLHHVTGLDWELHKYEGGWYICAKLPPGPYLAPVRFFYDTSSGRLLSENSQDNSSSSNADQQCLSISCYSPPGENSQDYGSPSNTNQQHLSASSGPSESSQFSTSSDSPHSGNWQDYDSPSNTGQQCFSVPSYSPPSENSQDYGSSPSNAIQQWPTMFSGSPPSESSQFATPNDSSPSDNRQDDSSLSNADQQCLSVSSGSPLSEKSQDDSSTFNTSNDEYERNFPSEMFDDFSQPNTESAVKPSPVDIVNLEDLLASHIPDNTNALFSLDGLPYVDDHLRLNEGDSTIVISSTFCPIDAGRT